MKKPKAINTDKVVLEKIILQARKSLQALDVIEESKISAKKIGKFYKYLDSYAEDKNWFSYFAPTRYEGSYLMGMFFECNSEGRLVVMPENTISFKYNAWQEIPKSEYNAAKKKFMKKFEEAMA